MSWGEVADVAAAVCLVIGALLTLIAAIGILRFPDVLTRMHSATKPQVLGLVFICLAVALAQRSVGDGHAKLTLARGGERFAAIAFRTPATMPARIHALFRPEVKHWNGLQNLELVVDYWTATA